MGLCLQSPRKDNDTQEVLPDPHAEGASSQTHRNVLVCGKDCPIP